MLATLDLADPRRADREFGRLAEALRGPLPRRYAPASDAGRHEISLPPISRPSLLPIDMAVSGDRD